MFLHAQYNYLNCLQLMLPPYCQTTHQKKEATKASMSPERIAKTAPEGYKTNSPVHEQDISNEQVSLTFIFVP
jgi:hypothetical protein